MDSATEDEEISLLRQSGKFLKELGDAFARIEDVTTERELESIIRKLEPYQEDPQLLDAELGKFIPLLSDKFLHNLQNQPVLHRLCRILYTFCKVRGEKVIVGLLNNEPRWIEPILAVFSENDKLPWEQNYILLLWLSLLMLSPFDLATISSFSDKYSNIDLDLPDGAPGITSQVVRISIQHLSSATIERKAAASLLVRLCIRQDMLKLGLLGIVTQWAIATFQKAAAESQIHACLGSLAFLSGLVASGDQKILGPHLASIFRLSQRILEDEAVMSIRSSAIARKLIIKVQRNTVVHCLQAEHTELDTTEVVEQVISSLIELLADSDTPVRMTASKALSVITLKLDSDMADEVVDAVNASFHEELIDHDSNSFWSVNAAKWHGIVLTLGHLLHRRAVATEKIPDVLKSILYALSFEQRSTTGKSIGSNVRDAANYGLWAAARRLTTEELESIPASLFAIHDELYTSHSIQYIALNLLISACFDPDGNVRRGSSAALQELIGRHPNTIIEGIEIVQVVDYQAVGLRARASTKVSHAASRLDIIYEQVNISALFTWRGLFAAGSANRSDSAIFAGIMVARISSGELKRDGAVHDLLAVSKTVEQLFSKIRQRLSSITARDSEARQGLLLAASWIFSALNYRLVDAMPSAPGDSSILVHYKDFLLKNDPLSMPEFAYVFSDDFKPRASRSDLVTSAVLRFVGQLARFLLLLHTLDASIHYNWDKQKHFALLDKCLSRNDDIVLEQVPTAVQSSVALLSPTDAEELVQRWLTDLAPENKRPGQSADARILALGAAFNELPADERAGKKDIHEEILRFLLQRYIHVDTEARIVILQSLKLMLPRFSQSAISATQRENYLTTVATILLLALHDYTISERGDVGSLVRLAGLAAMQEAWSHGLLLRSADSAVVSNASVTHLSSLQLHRYAPEASQTEHLQASILRLSLEKLDRVRLAAIECWTSQRSTFSKDDELQSSAVNSRSANVTIDPDVLYLLDKGAPLPTKTLPDHDISSRAYFLEFLQLAIQDGPSLLMRIRILEGFCSTAGGAGSGASQNLLNARQALHSVLAEPEGKRRNSSIIGFLLQNVIDINAKLENDQRLVSVLEVAAFALDIGLLCFDHVSSGDPKTGTASPIAQWKSFFASIQRAHFKSKNITKLQICLDVYRGLTAVSEVADEAMKKIGSMLLHPIPAVRVTAAETLIAVGTTPQLVELIERGDWTRSVKELKEKVDGVRKVFDATQPEQAHFLQTV